MAKNNNIFSFLIKLAFSLIKGKRKSSGIAIYSSLIKKDKDLAFLKKKNGLASLEIIGTGGWCEAYKAELPGCNGKMIAIKKTRPIKSGIVLEEIKSEIDTVGQIRHLNILPLLAHISRSDCHYLVYEFMKNGSLQDMLTKFERGEAELDWFSRHKIALGIATDLEYLHMSHSPCIIHRNLKPANILLDDDMEARIASFGLAAAMPNGHTNISTIG